VFARSKWWLHFPCQVELRGLRGLMGRLVRTLLELVSRLGAIAGALLATYSSPAHSAEALL